MRNSGSVHDVIGIQPHSPLACLRFDTQRAEHHVLRWCWLVTIRYPDKSLRARTSLYFSLLHSGELHDLWGAAQNESTGPPLKIINSPFVAKAEAPVIKMKFNAFVTSDRSKNHKRHFNVPSHIRRKIMSSLSKELRQKYNV